jgi:hypothetical protein
LFLESPSPIEQTDTFERFGSANGGDVFLIGVGLPLNLTYFGGCRKRGPTCQINWLFARRDASAGVAPGLNHTADSAVRISESAHSIASSGRARAVFWHGIFRSEHGAGRSRSQKGLPAWAATGKRPNMFPHICARAAYQTDGFGRCDECH